MNDNPQTRPLPLILADIANFCWTVTCKDSYTGEQGPSGPLKMLTFHAAFFAPKNDFSIHVRATTGEPRAVAELMAEAFNVDLAKGTEIQEWLLSDFHQWQESAPNGKLHRMRSVVSAISELGTLGLRNFNGHPTVYPSKDFFAFMDNPRLVDDFSTVFNDVVIPSRLAKLVPIVEASVLKKVIPESSATASMSLPRL